ncbi:hypothetical protein ElyMa_001816600 [Elysia marginata]|uniref:Uncharacterized protein n=1 Tax=Elysia marginata TaxID=1093978 RepID=A0AAV4EHH3_9GAST|nr:hypothetical protein ElyMa_001816600 [Elysia marginata]
MAKLYKWDKEKKSTHIKADKLNLACQPRQQTVAEAVTSCQAQAPTSSSDEISAFRWYHQKWVEKAKTFLTTCPKFRNFKPHKKNQGNARVGQQWPPLLPARMIHNCSSPILILVVVFSLTQGPKFLLYHRRGMTNATGNKAHPSKQPMEHKFRLTEPAKSSYISMALSIKHVSL